ncbi:MAG: ABC transporter ATP-binding protein [Bdellovibrionota bacterium]
MSGQNQWKFPPPGAVVLEAQGLVRDLGTEVKTRAVNEVALTIREGEFVSLTGPSGSGKSTLLYLLGVLDRPTSGTVLVDGVDIEALDDNGRARLRNEKLGFIFQFHFLLPEFSVLENVTLPMKRRGTWDEEEIEGRALETLKTLGLEGLERRRYYQLSGGQQQRVAIARAVANEPRIMLADEPTGNLDTANAGIVMEIFEQLVCERGNTIVMVTHEPSFAARASRQIQLRDGKVVADLDQRGGRQDFNPPP